VLDVRDESHDEQEIHRPVAVDLVGERDVAIAGVAGASHRPTIIDDRARLLGT
jgi:hypothetical protein